MIKFEVKYSGSPRKICFSNGEVRRIKDGDVILMPTVDWYSTYFKSGRFTLSGKDIKPKEEKKEDKKTKKVKKFKGRIYKWH